MVTRLALVVMDWSFGATDVSERMLTTALKHYLEPFRVKAVETPRRVDLPADRVLGLFTGSLEWSERVNPLISYPGDKNDVAAVLSWWKGTEVRLDPESQTFYYMTTKNPQGYWLSFQVGGPFADHFKNVKLDPARRRRDRCRFCLNGHVGGLELKPVMPCPICGGSGFWPESAPTTVMVSDYLEWLLAEPEPQLPYAVVVNGSFLTQDHAVYDAVNGHMRATRSVPGVGVDEVWRTELAAALGAKSNCAVAVVAFSS